MRYLVLLHVFALALDSARADRLDNLQSAAATGYHYVDSEYVGRPFHIYVQLPSAYDENVAERYPTIYLLDGGTNYPMLSAYFFLLGIDEPMPEAIVVGISYGGRTRADGNYRSVDYTAPSAERADFGGAEKYQRFLADELIPLIEANYPSDASRRILFGQSLAGQFVLYSGITRPDLFWGRIASNTAIHNNLDFYLDLPIGEHSGNGRHLVMANASGDAERFAAPRSRWIEAWQGREDLPWELTVVTLEGERHASAAPLAFRAGMRVLFRE